MLGRERIFWIVISSALIILFLEGAFFMKGDR